MLWLVNDDWFAQLTNTEAEKCVTLEMYSQQTPKQSKKLQKLTSKSDTIDEWHNLRTEASGRLWCELIKITKFKWSHWKKNYRLMSNKATNKKSIIYKSTKIGRDVR